MHLTGLGATIETYTSRHNLRRRILRNARIWLTSLKQMIVIGYQALGIPPLLSAATPKTGVNDQNHWKGRLQNRIAPERNGYILSQSEATARHSACNDCLKLLIFIFQKKSNITMRKRKIHLNNVIDIR